MKDLFRESTTAKRGQDASLSLFWKDKVPLKRHIPRPAETKRIEALTKVSAWLHCGPIGIHPFTPGSGRSWERFDFCQFWAGKHFGM